MNDSPVLVKRMSSNVLQSKRNIVQEYGYTLDLEQFYATKFPMVGGCVMEGRQIIANKQNGLRVYRINKSPHEQTEGGNEQVQLRLRRHQNRCIITHNVSKTSNRK